MLVSTFHGMRAFVYLPTEYAHQLTHVILNFHSALNAWSSFHMTQIFSKQVLLTLELFDIHFYKDQKSET